MVLDGYVLVGGPQILTRGLLTACLKGKSKDITAYVLCLRFPMTTDFNVVDGLA